MSEFFFYSVKDLSKDLTKIGGGGDNKINRRYVRLRAYCTMDYRF